tara:strand:- start:59 stop:1243 length:1185 start_codon:yes stop_codon:yes gene_type:complete
MPVRVKKHTNKKRGNELTYATISIEDARNLRERDSLFRPNPKYDEAGKNKIIGELKKFYGESVDYDGALKKLSGFVYHGSTEEREKFQQRVGHDPPKPPKEELLVIKDKHDKSKEHYLSLKRVGKQLLLTPAPAIHNIMGHRREDLIGLSNKDLNKQRADKSKYLPDAFKVRKEKELTQFDDLLSILKKGFKSHDYHEENAYIKTEKDHRINYDAWGGKDMELENKGITKGDIFGLEIFPKKGSRTGVGKSGKEYKPAYRITEADPKNIASVNIQLAEGATKEQIAEKMEFYQDQLDPLNIPYRFFTVTEDDAGEPHYKRVLPKKDNLESRVLGTIALVGIGAGVLFLSPILTGNVVGNPNTFTNQWFGVALIVLGLLAGFSLIKKRKSIVKYK